MGQLFCCRKAINFQTKNHFLFQLNRFIPNSINDNNDILNFTSNSNNSHNEYKIKKYNYHYKGQCFKENLNSEKDKFKFLFYDISQNTSIIIEKKLEIVKSLEGLSELNLDQSLYLCGNSRLEANEGSFLFELNPINPKTKILVNSVYTHYYPSLISLENNYIFCIGGKNQIHCEYYNIEEKIWIPLPKLPEERYMCTLSHDSKYNSIYLFGGINSRKCNINGELYIENDYILRLKIDINLDWEKIGVKENYEKKLLKRISAGSLVFDDQKDNIYILGGENEKKQYLDDIITYNINSKNLNKTNQKLQFPTIFFNQYSKKYENNDYIYVFIDKFNNIIKIDRHDFIEWSNEKLDI